MDRAEWSRPGVSDPSIVPCDRATPCIGESRKATAVACVTYAPEAPLINLGLVPGDRARFGFPFQ